CKAITGDGQSKRALYENSDEIIYNYRRKIIFNGIAPNLDFADLRDRCISYETIHLKESERITEDEFNTRFTKIIPSVLGKIFQTLSKMLELHESIKGEISDPPRMADFTLYGECISRALGYTPFSFIDNYKERIKINSIDIVEAYPIISLIEKALKDIDHPAVIIGKVTPSKEAELTFQETDKNKNITIIEGLSHDSDMLASAYAASKVFVLPAKYETPGIAALEAGLAGANVVITKYGGTKEYFGDLATYVDPYSVESIKRGILQALEHKTNNKLKSHIQQNFLWDKVAKKTLEVYHAIFND
ncbi:MAG: glycosyltransferase, partial [Candidatus Marinimicrobia bacterium]|nr:glycosyltransferase [Candidatus Neomarinimicrobiota bacterium]